MTRFRIYTHKHTHTHLHNIQQKRFVVVKESTTCMLHTVSEGFTGAALFIATSSNSLKIVLLAAAAVFRCKRVCLCVRMRSCHSIDAPALAFDLVLFATQHSSVHGSTLMMLLLQCYTCMCVCVCLFPTPVDNKLPAAFVFVSTRFNAACTRSPHFPPLFISCHTDSNVLRYCCCCCGLHA